MIDGSIFKNINKTIRIGLIALVLILPISVLAAMSSTNYYIYADSVETGGGLSSGGLYDLEDTLGEGVISQASGATYNINAGYQAMVLGSLSMNINDNSIDLGDLNVSTIISASTTVTVTTDAQTGYTMSIQNAVWTGNPLADVVGGSVDIGQEEYGIAVSGSDAFFGDDRVVTSTQILATKNSPATGSQTVVTFKAAISPSTISGSRSQAVTIGVSANF